MIDFCVIVDAMILMPLEGLVGGSQYNTERKDHGIQRK